MFPHHAKCLSFFGVILIKYLNYLVLFFKKTFSPLQNWRQELSKRVDVITKGENQSRLHELLFSCLGSKNWHTGFEVSNQNVRHFLRLSSALEWISNSYKILFFVIFHHSVWNSTHVHYESNIVSVRSRW